MALARSLLRRLAVAARATTTTTTKATAMSTSTMTPPDSSRGQRRRPYTIVVEGNIGSGKTTFLDKFRDDGDNDRVLVLSEPVDRWRNVQGHNLLDLMYADPARWSLLFQTYVQLTMVQQHAIATDKPVKIMERSLLRHKQDRTKLRHFTAFFKTLLYH